MICNLLHMLMSFAHLLSSFLVGAVVHELQSTFSNDLSTRSLSTTFELPDGYGWSSLKFNGSIGGIDVEIRGRDLQDVYNQFQAMHSNITIEFNSTSVATESLEKRNKDGTHCCPLAGHQWNWARTDYIEKAIGYLQNLHGTCGVAHNSCVRISCDQNQAVFLCNDNPVDWYPDCGYIASYAQDLINDCTIFMGSPDTRFRLKGTCGQEFDTDRYNVVVTGQWCWLDSHLGPDYRNAS